MPDNQTADDLAGGTSRRRKPVDSVHYFDMQSDEAACGWRPEPGQTHRITAFMSRATCRICRIMIDDQISLLSPPEEFPDLRPSFQRSSVAASA